MLEACPWAPRYPQNRAVVFKCDDHAVHRYIGKEKEQYDGRQQKQIQAPVPSDPSKGALDVDAGLTASQQVFPSFKFRVAYLSAVSLRNFYYKCASHCDLDLLQALFGHLPSRFSGKTGFGPCRRQAA